MELNRFQSDSSPGSGIQPMSVSYGSRRSIGRRADQQGFCNIPLD
ncbi:hypothetical protein [Egbenema bharatensis]